LVIAENKNILPPKDQIVLIITKNWSNASTSCQQMADMVSPVNMLAIGTSSCRTMESVP